jgi:hypothetical protein
VDEIGCQLAIFDISLDDAISMGYPIIANTDASERPFSSRLKLPALL